MIVWVLRAQGFHRIYNLANQLIVNIFSIDLQQKYSTIEIGQQPFYLYTRNVFVMTTNLDKVQSTFSNEIYCFSPNVYSSNYLSIFLTSTLFDCGNICFVLKSMFLVRYGVCFYSQFSAELQLAAIFLLLLRFLPYF